MRCFIDRKKTLLAFTYYEKEKFYWVSIPVEEMRKLNLLKICSHMFRVIPFLFEIKVNIIICTFHRND